MSGKREVTFLYPNIFSRTEGISNNFILFCNSFYNQIQSLKHIRHQPSVKKYIVSVAPLWLKLSQSNNFKEVSRIFKQTTILIICTLFQIKLCDHLSPCRKGILWNSAFLIKYQKSMGKLVRRGNSNYSKSMNEQ